MIVAWIYQFGARTELQKRLNPAENDLILISSDTWKVAHTVCGALRQHLAVELELIVAVFITIRRGS